MSTVCMMLVTADERLADEEKVEKNGNLTHAVHVSRTRKLMFDRAKTYL